MKRLLEKLQNDRHFLKERIHYDSKALGNSLHGLSKRVLNNKYIPNDLGFIQSQGTILDCYVARLGQIERDIEELEAALAEMEEQ